MGWKATPKRLDLRVLRRKTHDWRVSYSQNAANVMKQSKTFCRNDELLIRLKAGIIQKKNCQRPETLKSDSRFVNSTKTSKLKHLYRNFSLNATWVATSISWGKSYVKYKFFNLSNRKPLLRSNSCIRVEILMQATKFNIR